MPLQEAPTNFEDDSSPENSLPADLAPGNMANIVAPEPRLVVNTGGGNTFGGYRLPTIRLHTERTYAEAQAAAAAEAATTATLRPAIIQRRGDIFAQLEAEVHNAQAWPRNGDNAPPPVVNLLPVTLPRQVAEPQLDELLRRVTQRNDLQNVNTVRLRIISAITMSLSRLSMFLPRLQHLDLSGSVLCSLRDLGCGLIHLNHLNVSNCGLNSFDGTSGMPSVRVLIADGNMIQRVGPLTQLPLLQRLSVQHNRISDLSLLTFLAMCPNLVEVELQGNPVCHLRLYRHTLQRNVRTLRRIDGLPVVDGETSMATTATTAGNTNVPERSVEVNVAVDINVEQQAEIARVVELNRRNTLLCRTSSTASNSSSVSTTSSIANTASDNEALSSLSSESNQEDQLQTQQQNDEDSAHYTPPSLAIRRLRRPATAPTIATELSMSNDDVFFDRPASASTAARNQQPSSVNSSSIMAGSVLDLVRRSRRPALNRRRGLAWMSESMENMENVENIISASSTSASSLVEIPNQQLVDSNSSSEVILNASHTPEG